MIHDLSIPGGCDAAGEAELQTQRGCGAAGEAEPPPTYVPTAAMEAMLKVRHDQIFRFGHTLEADAERPLREFAVDLRSLAAAILEDVQFHKPADQLERHIVKLGAMAMAFFDRLQSERGQ